MTNTEAICVAFFLFGAVGLGGIIALAGIIAELSRGADHLREIRDTQKKHLAQRAYEERSND